MLDVVSGPGDGTLRILSFADRALVRGDGAGAQGAHGRCGMCGGVAVTPDGKRWASARVGGVHPLV